MKTKNNTHPREYLTVLLRRRSVIALCCGILTLMLSFYGIIAGVNKMIAVFHESGFSSFVYYTMLSNTLAALSVAFVFPFAVEGVRKKRFVLPKWVAVMHYIATNTIALTMVFVYAFISWVSPEDAFGGSNIVTHVFCPILILIFFFQIEGGHMFTWKDRLLAIVPFCLYTVIYLIEVVVIGEENGGWKDIYRIKEFLTPLTAITILLLVFGVTIAIALISNHFTKKRMKRMFSLWSEELEPIEVRIEAYGLGLMAGQRSDKNGIQIPYDILTFLAKKYGMDPEDLMKPFMKGLMTELKERDDLL